MQRRPITSVVPFIPFIAAILLAAAIPLHAAQPPAATAAFESYIRIVESRLDRQRAQPLAAPDQAARLRRGEILTDEITPDLNTPGGLLHDWRSSAFVPRAKADDIDSLLRDFADYSRIFAPQVVHAAVLSRLGNHVTATMRFRQHHVLTVVLDSTFDVNFVRLDPHRGATMSRSTRISEVADAGTSREHPLSDAEEHGFLWRMNTYWDYEERDGGLYLQIESVSLSRDLPPGLAWAIRPFVESVPRESLEFTLKAASSALRSGHPAKEVSNRNQQRKQP